ncbi:hypothetical protein [Enterobacter bugandensis]|uniref:hypothetical protein n=1 Tax=Enterobacter bugandensis TaxID=881260 RepID=UPI002FCFC491
MGGLVSRMRERASVACLRRQTDDEQECEEPRYWGRVTDNYHSRRLALLQRNPERPHGSDIIDTTNLYRHPSDGNLSVAASEASSNGQDILASVQTTPGQQRKLLERFNRLGPEAEARFNNVKNLMSHEINSTEKYVVLSDRAGIRDTFENEYRPERWTFRSNFRADHRDYYANDVARFQYSKIARALGFYGHMPTTVLRENVINSTTLKKTQDLKSGSERLKKTFLTKTPNGKSTARILKDFGLVAVKVNKLEDDSFEIEVRPESMNDRKDYN